MYDRLETACAGFVASEPDLRRVKNGELALLSFSLGVGGDQQNNIAPQFVRVAVFGERAEQFSPQIKKGSRVYCEGELKLTEWDGHAGQKRHGLNLSAWRCEPMGQIGRNKPKRQAESENPAPGYGSSEAAQHPFDDALPM